MRRLRPLSLLGAILGLVACGGGGAPPPPPPSVLLLLADTLRADKLGAYGSALGLTPALDALAARGVVFEEAFAHAPWTLPAAASLLTSLHPQQHGAGGRLPGFRALDPGVPTLASVLRRAGFETAAIVNVSYLGEQFGLTRGFDHVDREGAPGNRAARRAGATTDAALAWLASRSAAPFLLLVHYFDPHTAYDPPQPFRRAHAAPADREGAFRFGSGEEVIALRDARRAPAPELLRRAERLYDGEVAYLDAEIGRLLRGVAELGLDGSTLVLATADHGEEFLDHGGFEHGHTLYRELLHVPLILAGPGSGAPRRVAALVRHVDVAPTLCELLRVAAPAGFAGRSLLPLLRGGELPPAPALAYGNFWGPPLVGLREGGHALILPAAERGADAGRAPELYRTHDDPREQRDLAAREPELTAQLRARSAALVQRLGRRRTGPPVELSPRDRDQLRALGYAE